MDAVQVTTGERTGTLVHSLAAIATLYRERFQRGLQRFLRVLQVVIVLSAFAFIGWKTMKAYKEARKRVDSAHQILEKEMQRLYRGPAGGLNLPALNLEEMHNERLPKDTNRLILSRCHCTVILDCGRCLHLGLAFVQLGVHQLFNDRVSHLFFNVCLAVQ